MARLTQYPLMAILIALFSLTACQAVIHEKGSILDPKHVAQIEVGKTTMAEVKNLLGVPTFVNNFRKGRWSYVQDRQFKNIQRTFSRVINRVDIIFDERGIVKDIKHNFDDTLLDPRTTPNAQNDQSWLRWLWEGEYMRPATKSQHPEDASSLAR